MSLVVKVLKAKDLSDDGIDIDCEPFVEVEFQGRKQTTKKRWGSERGVKGSGVDSFIAEIRQNAQSRFYWFYQLTNHRVEKTFLQTRWSTSSFAYCSD